MRIQFIVPIILVGALAAVTPALAAQPPAAVPETSQAAPGTESGGGRQAQADSNRQICVMERLSDSRMRRRICRTQREWQELQGDDAR
jgi:hypothetical protein